jgi:hypothetical protein
LRKVVSNLPPRSFGTREEVERRPYTRIVVEGSSGDHHAGAILLEQGNDGAADAAEPTLFIEGRLVESDEFLPLEVAKLLRPSVSEGSECSASGLPAHRAVTVRHERDLVRLELNAAA